MDFYKLSKTGLRYCGEKITETKIERCPAFFITSLLLPYNETPTNFLLCEVFEDEYLWM